MMRLTSDHLRDVVRVGAGIDGGMRSNNLLEGLQIAGTSRTPAQVASGRLTYPRRHAIRGQRHGDRDLNGQVCLFGYGSAALQGFDDVAPSHHQRDCLNLSGVRGSTLKDLVRNLLCECPALVLIAKDRARSGR
jgi:hypothetical protein